MVKRECPPIAGILSQKAELHRLMEEVLPAKSAVLARKPNETTMAKLVGLSAASDKIYNVFVNSVTNRGMGILNDMEKSSMAIAKVLKGLVDAEIIDVTSVLAQAHTSQLAVGLFKSWMDWKVFLPAMLKIETKLDKSGAFDAVRTREVTVLAMGRKWVGTCTCLTAALRPLEEGETRKKLIAAGRKGMKEEQLDEKIDLLVAKADAA
jgi:hypothetical protein